VNTPIARVSFRRCSRDVRSRDAAAEGAGLALAAAAGVDEVAGRGTSDLAAPAAAPASLPEFRGAVGGLGFVEVVPREPASLLVDGDRLGAELALPGLEVALDPDRSAWAGEGVCADEGAVAPVLAVPASEPCEGLCCSAGSGGADAGELD
jgi:hypothetical protein